jgi:mono/diheme cytochrome c family protein
LADVGPIRGKPAAQLGSHLQRRCPVGVFANTPDSVPIVDTGNYYPRQRDGRIDAIESGLPESKWVAHQFGTPVVKAFNNIYARHLLELGRPKGTPDRIALPVAGDDQEAKAIVLRLIDDLGFDPVDAGGLDESWRQWRVTYSGDPDAPIEAAPTSSVEAKASPNALPPEGVQPDAGATANLPVPPGSTAEQVALGRKVFHGKVGGGTCAGCHGADGIGTPVGANLASGMWLWGDGDLPSITNIIRDGVPKPKQHLGAMPPFGGVHLSDQDLAAVAAYVWAIGHQRKG